MVTSSRQPYSPTSSFPAGARQIAPSCTSSVSTFPATASASVALLLHSAGAPAEKVVAAATAVTSTTAANRRGISGSTGTGDSLLKPPISEDKPSRKGLQLLLP
ncbi:hypothetical protein VaNZ11_005902, partial [Volvox africanus]